jgi:hypothetical protein
MKKPVSSIAVLPSLFRTFGAMLLICTVVAGQPAVTIEADDHRPLAAAVVQLQHTLGLTINYEDIPYQHKDDLEDVSTEQQRALYPGYSLLVPRKSRVTSTILSGPNSPEGEKVRDLQSLLNSYRIGRLPGDFTLEQSNGMLYVIPSKARMADGVTREVVSPMKAEITIPFAERSVVETVVVILDSISRSSGLKISAGRIPFHPTHKIGFSATRQQGRDALASLLSQVSPRGAYYHLLFDPVAGYMLNLEVLARPDLGQPVDGTGAHRQSSNDRFFVR